jgi:hypothetical protein
MVGCGLAMQHEDACIDAAGMAVAMLGCSTTPAWLLATNAAVAI